MALKKTQSENPVSIIDHETYPQAVTVTTNFTIHEGDLVFWDGANYSARPLEKAGQVESGGENNSKGFMGVALTANKPQIYGPEAGKTEETPVASVTVGCRMTIFLYGVNTHTYRPYEWVTVAEENPQLVTNIGATEGNGIGVVIVDPPATAREEQATPVPETVETSGYEGTRIRVLLTPKHIVGKNV